MSERQRRAPLVVEDLEGHRFVVNEGGSEAELVYELDGNRMILVHTGVPESMAGKGIGGMLVRAAVDRAARDHLTAVPLCPFARRWIRSHSAEVSKVDVDWKL